MILNRRHFLRALGLTGAAAAAPGGLLRLARADGTLPKRLIIFSTGHGTVYDGWKMRPAGQPDGSAWEMELLDLSASDFSRALEPLHAYRDRLSILDGLSLASAELDISGYRHEKGWIHAWTGDWAYFTGTDLFSTGPSLDQIVAAEIARSDRLTSLELQVGEGRPICHAGQAQQLPLEGDPARVYERLFGLAGSTDPLVRGQGSALDYAMAEHDALSAKLGAADREKLETHFSLVRQLEQRIEGLTQISCDGPDLSQLASSSAGYDQIFRSMVDLIAAAFSCDLTRVVSLSMDDIPADDFGWGHVSGDAHNDFAHQLYSDADAASAMTDYTRFHSEQLAYLISVLESIPEGDGTLMDNTLIVWGGELGDGWHGFEKYCSLIVGGEWYFQPGRYHHWPYETTTPIEMLGAGGMIGGSGVPHQRMLVSVARAMGVEVDSVGLSQVAAQSGSTVSVSGELTELL